MYILCTTSTCVDPEGFVSGGPTLTTFLGVDKKDPNTTISGLSSIRQRNAI